MQYFISTYQSAVGLLVVKADSIAVKEVLFSDEDVEIKSNSNTVTEKCCLELDEYFNGCLKELTVALNPDGTDFQKRVWQELMKISFGKASTYLQMARRLGDEKCIRAAASANGKNPIAIIIPCHRVVGSDGSLTGYAGGLWRKKWLLEHEGVLEKNQLELF